MANAMTDDDRDDRDELEETLRRADELEQANAELAARNTALVAGGPPPVIAKRRRGGVYVLAATSVLAGTVLAMIPGCELLAALGFMLPVFWLIAVGMGRIMLWLDDKNLL